jgi:glycosyltransferase involved in cell wall biosynthesis
MVSKACIVGQYQTKLERLARHPDLDLTVVVPPYWRDERGVVPLERVHTQGYRLQVEPIAFQGRFHLHYYPTLPRLLHALRPDLVHIDEEPYNLATFLALRAARAVGAHSLFFTWQNLPRRYPPPFSWMETFTFRHSGGAIAGSVEAMAVLRAKGFHGPIDVIPQFGVDPELFDSNRPKVSSDSTFRIGYAGRLVEEKGLQVLLRAVADLAGDWELHLLGSGPFKPTLANLALRLGISRQVCFDPPRPSTQMPAFYAGLDLYVQPSLTRTNWKEQFGRVLIEAMACQVPVIGSDSGEIPHVLGDAGLVFPEGNAAALRAQIETLRSDPSRRAQVGARGRRRVLDNYTQEIIASRTYAFYRRIVHSQSPRRPESMD